MKIVALAHPCSALSLLLVFSVHSEPPSRNGVEYQEKQRRRGGQKEERGYKSYINGKATSSLLLWRRVSRLARGSVTVYVCVCLGTREVNRTH